MSQEFDAIYTQGHLVPLEPVSLRESERVRVVVEPARRAPTNGLDLSGMNLHEALVATGLLGIVKDEPPSLH